jgi:hypothetical protein
MILLSMDHVAVMASTVMRMLLLSKPKFKSTADANSKVSGNPRALSDAQKRPTLPEWLQETWRILTAVYAVTVVGC